MYSDNQKKQFKLNKKKAKIKILKAENEKLKSEILQLKAGYEVKINGMQDRINQIEENSMKFIDSGKKFVNLQKEVESLNEIIIKKEQREAVLEHDISNLKTQLKNQQLKYQETISELNAEQQINVIKNFYMIIKIRISKKRVLKKRLMI